MYETSEIPHWALCTAPWKRPRLVKIETSTGKACLSRWSAPNTALTVP